MPLTKELLDYLNCDDKLIDHVIELVKMWEQIGRTFELPGDIYASSHQDMIHIMFTKYGIEVSIDNTNRVTVESVKSIGACYDNQWNEQYTYPECKKTSYVFKSTNNIDYARIINAIIDIEKHFGKFHPDY